MPSKKRIVKPVKRKVATSRAVLHRSSLYGRRGLIGLLVAIVIIFGSLYFMAREYGKGPLTNLLATTIGIKRIAVDADDGTIVPKTPDINITAEAYEDMQAAQKEPDGAKRAELTKKAKDKIRDDVEATAVIKTRVNIPAEEKDADKPAVAPVVVVASTGPTCPGINNNKFKVGDTVVGPLIPDTTLNSVYTCQVDGSWLQKMCPETSKNPCSEEKNPETITIKPTYMLINDGLKDDNPTKFNCNKNGVVYASGSQIDGTTDVCQNGNWVPNTKYIEALERDCGDLKGTWVKETNKCNLTPVKVGECKNTCTGAGILSECSTDKDGERTFKISQCPTKTCNKGFTGCGVSAPVLPNIEISCQGNNLISRDLNTSSQPIIIENCENLNPSQICDTKAKNCVINPAITTYLRVTTEDGCPDDTIADKVAGKQQWDCIPKPVVGKEFATVVSGGKTSFQQCFDIIKDDLAHYDCVPTDKYANNLPVYKISELPGAAEAEANANNSNTANASNWRELDTNCYNKDSNCKSGYCAPGDLAHLGFSYCAIRPAPPIKVLEVGKEFSTVVSGKTSGLQCFDFIKDDLAHYWCEPTDQYVSGDRVYKVSEIASAFPSDRDDNAGKICRINLNGLLYGDRCTQICPLDSSGNPNFAYDDDAKSYKCGKK